MPDRTDFDPANKEELLGLNSRAYDLVINGEELGGGSIRIHEMKTQEKIFRALGLSRGEVETKFGFFLKAMEYGVPPHGGIALGLDRIIAMVLKEPSIREVIAFPKNRSALCPLTRAPSPVDMSQLEELGLVADIGAGIFEEGISQLEEKMILMREGKEAQIISQEDVRHVAKLARLRLTDQEIDSYQRELNSVLEHFKALQELDTENARPMSHVLELKNVWREDKPDKLKKPDSLLTNAPMRESDYFKVPKILEG
jgi:aspartyl-tRNA synthetase